LIRLRTCRGIGLSVLSLSLLIVTCYPCWSTSGAWYQYRLDVVFNCATILRKFGADRLDADRSFSDDREVTAIERFEDLGGRCQAARWQFGVGLESGESSALVFGHVLPFLALMVLSVDRHVSRVRIQLGAEFGDGPFLTSCPAVEGTVGSVSRRVSRDVTHQPQEPKYRQQFKHCFTALPDIVGRVP